MADRQGALAAFLMPKPSKALAARIACVALGAYLFFGFVCRPAWIRGSSMEPAYSDGGFVLLWKPWARSGVRSGDVVAAAISGDSVMLLKRVVATEGQTVEFRSGRLYIDGKPESGPGAAGRCSWSLPPRKVEAGCVYLVGDNRSMPMDSHIFGQAGLESIVGKPVW